MACGVARWRYLPVAGLCARVLVVRPPPGLDDVFLLTPAEMDDAIGEATGAPAITWLCLNTPAQEQRPCLAVSIAVISVTDAIYLSKELCFSAFPWLVLPGLSGRCSMDSMPSLAGGSPKDYSTKRLSGGLTLTLTGLLPCLAWLAACAVPAQLSHSARRVPGSRSCRIQDETCQGAVLVCLHAGRFPGAMDGLSSSAPSLGGQGSELPVLRGGSPNSSFMRAPSDSGPALQPIPESPGAAQQHERRMADMQRADRM